MATTSFWKARWLGNGTLAQQYPTLFNNEGIEDGSVVEHGWWEGGFWYWHYPKLNALLSGATGEEEEESLKNILSEIQPIPGAMDKCVWIPNSEKQFSVLSFYNVIIQVEDTGQLHESTKEALELLWETKVPSKIKIFNWRLLLDKLPTSYHLIRRNIIPDVMENRCPLCAASEENTLHLFLNCPTTATVWKQVLTWLDREHSIQIDIIDHFLSFNTTFKGKYGKNKERMVWMDTTWSVWRMRNDLLFNSIEVDVGELVFNIKLVSRLWLGIDRKKFIGCTFYSLINVYGLSTPCAHNI
ncbi:uncharacterized protein LOC131613343 [Vicia villosa]|uniref:uncharacterized protein LOC131613343 n=1 Tax=Vicia villosa TaxID=3911 RepID=UPI00273BFADD|nr:uncharacterized protein LOC131613343 [Vicia villosa]